MRGYFAIGIYGCKTRQNIGSLWRSANLYGAAFVFTIAERYSKKRHGGCADTMNTPSHIPLLHFSSLDSLKESLTDCPLVGVELHERATLIDQAKHRERACYLLGAEDNGLSREALEACHYLIQLPGAFSMNVACAGTVVMHDRWHKRVQ